MDFIFKLSICLAVTWLFYWLLLRRLTFYRWNRIFLLVYPAVSFLVPFINISDLLHQQTDDQAWLRAIPVLEQYAFRLDAEESVNWLAPANIGWLVFAAGCLTMMARFCWRYWSLRKAVSGAVLLAHDEARLYHVNKRIAPFSFGRSIYINKHLHSDTELQEILRHEFIHVKQRHSFDMIWAELLCIINWYNPFAWLLRNAIRQNLEFIADHQVLANGVDKKQYQYILLKVTGMMSYSVANNFNLSSLKKRIIMMNKKTSASVHLLRFVLIVPVLAVLLLAFRSVTGTKIPLSHNPLNNSSAAHTFTHPADKIGIDTVPAKRKSASDSIENMHVIKNGKASTVRIRLINGKEETYDLNDAKQKTDFELKYGKLKAPKPPAPPARPSGKDLPAAPVPPAPPAPESEIIVEGRPLNAKIAPGNKEVVVVQGKPMKAPKKAQDSKEVIILEGKPLKPTGSGDKGDKPDPLIVVDGKIEPYGVMYTLPPSDIESITVLKDEAAVSKYGEKGKNGVILVTTVADQGQNKNTNTGDVNIDNLCKSGALIIVNGKKMDCDKAGEFLKKNKNQIESVYVFKGEEQVKKATGESGKSAIVINTKKIAI